MIFNMIVALTMLLPLAFPGIFTGAEDDDTFGGVDDGDGQAGSADLETNGDLFDDLVASGDSDEAGIDEVDDEEIDDFEDEDFDDIEDEFGSDDVADDIDAGTQPAAGEDLGVDGGDLDDAIGDDPIDIDSDDNNTDVDGDVDTDTDADSDADTDDLPDLDPEDDPESEPVEDQADPISDTPDEDTDIDFDSIEEDDEEDMDIIIDRLEISGSISSETIAGTDADEEILGLEGNDFLSGGNGSDILRGGGGDDNLAGTNPPGTGDATDDTADFLHGDSGADTLYLGDFDSGEGGSGQDTFIVEDDVDEIVTVSDFDANFDVLEVEQGEGETLSVSAQELIGGSTIVTLSNGVEILFEGLTTVPESAISFVVES